MTERIDPPERDEPPDVEPSGSVRRWGTAPDELSEQLLGAILNDRTVRAALDGADDSRQQIRLHEAPLGFRQLVGKLADELFISYSGLSRVALGHGMAILEATSWISHLRVAYEAMHHKGMAGDSVAMDRLGPAVRYNYRQSRPLGTTLDASRATAARISDLALICGVPRAVVAVIAMIMSLLTLRNHRGYRELLRAEVEAFRRFVMRRTQELQLEEPQ